MADLNIKDRTQEFDPQDIQNNKTMGILAYISWLVLVPIFAAKESKFARFHANQGLILAIVEAACWISLAILGALTWIPVVKIFAYILMVALYLVLALCVVFTVLGIVSASKGQAKEFPLIGSIKILK